MSDRLRLIPSVNELLEHGRLKPLAVETSHASVVRAVRSRLQALREAIQANESNGSMPSLDQLAVEIEEAVRNRAKPHLRKVINATGILLHTGLGRAPLAEEAIKEVIEMAGGYASVELDLESGERSQRVLAVEPLLVELTGAEAAVVVNNNAGATMLTLAALATGREVIVSRGQLVEIGGSFRLPDVMTASGAVLKEVGTTNRTRLSDYASAIGDRTAALMRVHTSNFRIVGFTADISISELVSLGRDRKVPVVDDVGSGALVDFNQFGLHGEPSVVESVRAGADLVLFSGDKLLGGPQCGIVVGRREYVAKLAQHPMTRALRVDKLTLAALAATLRLYLNPAAANERIPLLQLLSISPAELRERAEKLAAEIDSIPGINQAVPCEDVGYIGGGSVPEQGIPTWCVAVQPAAVSASELAARLRQSTPSALARVQRDLLLLDLRTVFASEDQMLLHAVRSAWGP